MKRHVAATLLGVLGFLIIDSHFDWVGHDNGTLLEVNGQQFDPKGWMAEHWRQLHPNCRPVHNEIAITATATAAITWTTGVYDLEIVFPSGDVRRLVYGTVTVSPEVTR